MIELPSISIRKYIRRGNGPAEEPTRYNSLPSPDSNRNLSAKPSPSSTLVLTSAAKSYVDVRVLKPTVPNGAMEELDWAFAGTSTTTPLAGHSGSGTLTEPMHTAWAHWIDSETEDEVNDEGDMYPQPDGTVLEKGVNGDGSTYEELWEELDARVTGKDWGKRASYVLRTEDPATRTRGMCIRIGDWVQGTLRVGEEFTVVRWQWSVELSEWKEVLKIGKGTIPCESLFEGFKHDGKPAMNVGGIVTAGDQMSWTCIEAFIW